MTDARTIARLGLSGVAVAETAATWTRWEQRRRLFQAADESTSWTTRRALTTRRAPTRRRSGSPPTKKPPGPVKTWAAMSRSDSYSPPARLTPLVLIKIRFERHFKE